MDLSEYWFREFEFAREDAFRRSDSQNQIGQSALKSMMIANGGAIISLLTFAGNKGAIADPSTLKYAFLLFGGGLITGLLAYFFAYFSQSDAMQIAYYRARHAQSKMLEGEDVAAPPVYERRANVLLYSAVVLLLASLILFGVGSVFAINAIL